jgi:soluble lytic murein transglycosylase-like protein
MVAHLTRVPLLFAVVWLAASAALGERAFPRPTPDFDAEFARAADLLEEGRREEAEQVLETLVRSADQPAWNARAAMLLGASDARSDDWAGAAAVLETANAAPIGLEAYRNLRRAEALELSGRRAEALEPARLAFEAEGRFAFRIRAATLLARLCELQGQPAEAARVLALASEVAASPDESAEVAIERIRLALARGDALVARSAARDLLLKAPTHDALSATPAFARRAAAEAEKSLSPAERGRRGRALVAAGDPRRGVLQLSRNPPRDWPDGERGSNLLTLARGQFALKRTRAAEEAAARVPDDGTLQAYEARLFRCDLVAARLSGRRNGFPAADDARFEPVLHALESLTAPDVPASVRRGARERLLRMAADREDFDAALVLARELARENPDGADGFEPLWRLSWQLYRDGDYAGAQARFEALRDVYRAVSISRRLDYWTARCLERQEQTLEAEALFAELAAAEPPDLYARFARAHVERPARREQTELPDPSKATAAFARVDELLRLRMFEEAAAEARILLPSRGRDLRIAQADFALGRFLTAASSIKRALPEIGTAEESRVPEAWRRLYYPIEEGGLLPERAREFSLDAAVLRGLVRQESVFDANAKSRAGALGLMQLMPATAQSLTRTVLRARYRHTFLYDPGVNTKLGAAYLRKLIDRFDNSTLLALAAYNGGPTRIARLVRENPGLPEDELFESIPLYETRDYVRRVMLYAESYRELYP